MALSANFWMNDGLIMAESLAIALTALAVWLTYRARVSAGWYSLVALGAVCSSCSRGSLRLRAPAEPSIAVLGTVGIVALVGRFRPSWALRPELAAPGRETGAV